MTFIVLIYVILPQKIFEVLIDLEEEIFNIIFSTVYESI